MRGYLGAPSFTVVSGGIYVEPALAEAACGAWTTPNSWPVDMNQQAVNINSTAHDGDHNHVWYKDRLYKFNTNGPNTTLQVCTSFDANKLKPVPPGPIPIPPIPTPPGGQVKPIGFFMCPDGRQVSSAAECNAAAQKSSFPIVAVAVLAVAAGVGVAYLVTQPPKKPQQARQMLEERRRRLRYSR